MRQFLIAIIVVVLLLISNSSISAYYTNMPASLVLGQPNFGSSGSNRGKGLSSPTANSFFNLNGIVVINQKLVVADYSNNRILIWNSIPTTNDVSADVVIGQPNMTSNSANQGLPSPTASTLQLPWELATDGQKLIVTDQTNNRVLIYNQLPTSNNAPADVVIGQTDMNTNTSGTSSTKLNAPLGVFYDKDSGKLFVGELNNRRILIYNSLPTTNGVAADVVLGQVDFDHGSLNQGKASPDATTLGGVYGITVAASKLIASDLSNYRVLIWNSIPTTNDKAADVVIGHPNMTSSAPNDGGAVGANTLNNPEGLISDGNRLFIADQANRRVLVFNQIPTTNGSSADLALGQPNLVSNSVNQGGNPSSISLTGPTALLLYNNKLFVSDAGGASGNNRFLIFNNIVATPEISLGGLEKLSDGRIKIKGNLKLGEAGHYDLGAGGGLVFSVNGSDGVGVNTIGNQINDGAGSLFYDFTNTFDPWTSGNGTKEDWLKDFDGVRSTRGFTVKITSKNSNTDTSHIFYSEPFKLTSFSSTSIKFLVNKYQIQRIKDNIDHFEVWTKKEGQDFKAYVTNTSTDKIDSNGLISTSPTNTKLSLSKGIYSVKVVAVSKDSNYRQDSNTMSVRITNPIASISYINPLNFSLTTNQWFPLQVSSISGTNVGIISSFNPTSISDLYTTTTNTPTIKGVAFSRATVAARLTDIQSGNHKDYLTTADKDSTFALTPSLYPTSILTISTYDMSGHYNELLPITLTLATTQQVQEVTTEISSPTPTPQPTTTPTPQTTPRPKTCFLWWCW